MPKGWSKPARWAAQIESRLRAQCVGASRSTPWGPSTPAGTLYTLIDGAVEAQLALADPPDPALRQLVRLDAAQLEAVAVSEIAVAMGMTVETARKRKKSFLRMLFIRSLMIPDQSG